MERICIAGLLLHITVAGAVVRTRPTASSNVRLVNGDGPCSGRVEIYHRGQWGTVCDNDWNIYAAKVVCRQLHCGKALDIKVKAYFGEGSGVIWMSSVQCSGSEGSLAQCRHRKARTCSHDEDAGVICSGSVDVKLVHGNGRCSGRVEVKRDGQWGTICTKDTFCWDEGEADTVCKQLLCGEALSPKMNAYFGEGSGNIAMTDVICFYRETAISDCPESWRKTHCDHAHDVGVICSGAVRLVNGTDRCSGRVEVYYDGRWGTVCDDDWDMDDAQVVCKELGCGRALGAEHRAHYGEGSGDIWISDVKCSGMEESLALCLHSDSAAHSCGHNQDAGVFCSESVKVRLVNGTNRCSGRVEVYYNGQWGTVCSNDWDINDAEVVCRQLHCGKALDFKNQAFFGQGSGEIWMSGVNCSGDEDSVAYCHHIQAGSHSCSHDADAGVVCSDSVKVRLVNGYQSCTGRVEVNYDGHWGRVCDDDWDLNDAEVVCRQMGCGPAFKALGTYFGVGAEPALLDSVKCSGQESSLTQCEHSGFGIHSWGQHAANGVICSGPVRLVNGTSHCSGRVEVYYNDQWGTVCGDDWGMEDAEVVCRQLSCGRALRAINFAYFGEGSEEIWISGVKCSGLEKSLSQCPHNRSGSHSCSHSEDAGVVCSESTDVRLFGGPDPCSGRVEVLYHGGAVVCNDGWDMTDAEVVCRQLGCGNALDISRNSQKFALTSNAKFSLYKAACSGQESSIKDIKVRLVNGANRCSGVVEVYYRGQRGRVCYSKQEYMGSTCGWRKYDGAVVVCKELGCGPAIDVYRTAMSSMAGRNLSSLEIMCSGEEKNLTQCSLLGFDCSPYNYLASVECTASVRLVDGPDRCSGRVEVNHDGRWGTVCDDDWDLEDAQVVCREMECGTAQSAKRRAYFGAGTGKIWMNKLKCSGTEGFLKECSHRGFRRHDCGHHQDAGVICSAAVRLVNGTGRCSGRVEVYRHGQWGTVCGKNWDMMEAEVVCLELGCGTALDYKRYSFFGEGSGDIWMSGVMCDGHEDSVLHCHYDGPGTETCGHHQDAGVICSESEKVRLADGPDVCIGRVEVYSKGQWGTVCDDGWDLNEADVVCRELGCGLASEVKLGAFYGPGSGDILMTDVNCTGSEGSLTKCPHSRLGKQKCGHHEDAGVVCAGK
uniref:scavenger receptor cysteine-rich domain-containing protein DMBT1-like n=1 Tax=Centroberyx gerrardi TaxID=166262 RepID=UPI003AAD6448